MLRSCLLATAVLAMALLATALLARDAMSQAAAPEPGAAPLAAPVRTEAAPGVHVFATSPYGDVGLDGNSVAIVGDDGVLVFDSNGTPAAAGAVLAEIRALTDLPVRYLVHSHWHWDHWYGAQVYRDAFPGLVVVSHAATRALMAGPALEFNRPGIEQQLPGHIAAVEAELAAATAPAEIARLRGHVAQDRFFLEQKRASRPVLADIVFTDRLTLHLGSRVVEVRHHERAVTPGDAWLWLPQDRLIVAGDLLIDPLTFALFCYPGGWIATLHALDALDAEVLVPGHGATQHDEEHLHATLALLERELVLARAGKERGEPLDAVLAAALADAEVLALRARLTGGDARLDESFALFMVDWFLRRVWQELDAPLDDAIPSSP
jgi:cyclase